MTLTGFEHSKKTILKKERLIIKAKRPEQIEVVSRSNRSKSSRKSSLRASSKNIDDSDEDDASENASDISHPPMNEDIESLNHNEQDSNENQAADKPQARFEQLPPGVPTEALNPRSYAFVPSNLTQRIRAAGSKTIPSESVGNIMH